MIMIDDDEYRSLIIPRYCKTNNPNLSKRSSSASAAEAGAMIAARLATFGPA